MKTGYAFITVLLLSTMFFPLAHGSGLTEDDVSLITCSEDYKTYGFRDHGYYYTPESLTCFYMPLVIEKSIGVLSISKSDLSYKIPRQYMKEEKHFNKRQPDIDYEILDENDKYVLVLACMNVQASTDPFSIDFVPTIKGVDISKFAWWNSSWNRKKEITINHSQVPETLHDFPMLVNLSDSDLYNQVQSDGGDIVFVDSTETTQFYHEIEYIDVPGVPGNVELRCWVNVTQVFGDVDTVLYMYYNNSVVGDQYNNESTWNDDYILVNHFHNWFNDSTGNGNVGTNHGTENGTGIVANCRDFNRSATDYLNYSTVGDYNSYTIEFWSHLESLPVNEYVMGNQGDFSFLIETNNNLNFELGAGSQADSGVGLYNTGSWMYTAGTTNGVNMYLYTNGVYKDTNVNNKNLNTPFWIGMEMDNGGADWYDGKIDEFRISKVARNSSWITATYNTIVNASPDGFFNMSVEILKTNNSPIITAYSPSDGSTVYDTATVNVSVYIEDVEGDLFNYTIETMPDIGHRYSNWTVNGSKVCNVSGLTYATTYTVYVNATDYYGSGNWTNITYSFHTVGGLQFNCFNESNTSQAIRFNIEISNQSGTEVFVAENIANGYSINLSDTPKGENTIIIVSNSSYETRVYYYDLVDEIFYNLSFYLPPLYLIVNNETVDTELYTIRVIDDYAYPVSDADITIKRYDNVTGIYETVTSLITNGYGEADAYLIPNTNYKFFVSCTGFEDFTGDSFTDPVFYGKNYPIILQIEYEEDIEPVYGFWDLIRFNASMYTNNTIRVLYDDTDENTNQAVFTTYEAFNDTLTLISINTTTSNEFVFWLTGINTSRQHVVYCDYDQVTIGTGTESVILFPLRDPLQSLTDINTIIGNILGDWSIGSGGLGFVEFFFIVLPTLGMILIATKGNHAGAGIFVGGCYLGFSSFIVFNATVVSVGLTVFICFIGGILEMVKGGAVKL